MCTRTLNIQREDAREVVCTPAVMVEEAKMLLILVKYCSLSFQLLPISSHPQTYGASSHCNCILGLAGLGFVSLCTVPSFITTLVVPATVQISVELLGYFNYLIHICGHTAVVSQCIHFIFAYA